MSFYAERRIHHAQVVMGILASIECGCSAHNMQQSTGLPMSIVMGVLHHLKTTKVVFQKRVNNADGSYTIMWVLAEFERARKRFIVENLLRQSLSPMSMSEIVATTSLADKTVYAILKSLEEDNRAVYVRGKWMPITLNNANTNDCGNNNNNNNNNNDAQGSAIDSVLTWFDTIAGDGIGFYKLAKLSGLSIANLKRALKALKASNTITLDSTDGLLKRVLLK